MVFADVCVCVAGTWRPCTVAGLGIGFIGIVDHAAYHCLVAYEADGARLTVGGVNCEVCESAATPNTMRAGIHRVEISSEQRRPDGMTEVGIGKHGHLIVAEKKNV